MKNNQVVEFPRGERDIYISERIELACSKEEEEEEEEERKEGRKEGRKEASWRLPVSAASPICLIASRVSSCTFFIQESRWRSPFDIFCLDALALAYVHPLAASLRGNSLSLSLCLSVCVEKCLHHPLDDGGISIFTGRYSGARTYIQMERLAFPRVHSRRVQPAGATRGRTRGSLATKTQTES